MKNPTGSYDKVPDFPQVVEYQKFDPEKDTLESIGLGKEGGREGGKEGGNGGRHGGREGCGEGGDPRCDDEPDRSAQDDRAADEPAAHIKCHDSSHGTPWLK